MKTRRSKHENQTQVDPLKKAIVDYAPVQFFHDKPSKYINQIEKLNLNQQLDTEKEKFLADPNGILCCMEHQDGLIAFVLLSPNKSGAIIRLMYTMGDWRCLGAMSKILKKTSEKYGSIIGDPVDLRAMNTLKKAGFKVDSNTGVCKK